jgi:hypothetical protein
VPDSQKVTADSYQASLCQHVTPWLSARYPEVNYMFQQDGDPAHTTNSTQRFLESNMTSKLSKAVWPPPYLPDFHPLQYGNLRVLQAKVNTTALENKNFLVHQSAGMEPAKQCGAAVSSNPTWRR